MNLVLTAPTGQVGAQLIAALAPIGTVTPLDRRTFDLSRPDQLPSIIRGIAPDVIVNAAAYTAVDDAEREEELATTVNGIAVGVIAEEARRARALLVHYSTDYVFDGRKDSPYDEDDPPCPVNAYGRSKLAGETAIREVGGPHVILRTSWVYGARGRNFLRTILGLLRERDELRIVADQVGAPTRATEIAEATAVIIAAAGQERACGSFTSGLFHLTSSGATSWHGFAAQILNDARKYGLLPADRAPRLVPVTTEEFRRPATRPKNSRLAGDRVRERFGIALPEWQECVSRCLEEISAAERG